MSGPFQANLIDGGTATGNPVTWPGGVGMFDVDCTTPNGATIRLEFKNGAGNWTPVDRSGDTFTTYTASDKGKFELGAGVQIRAAVITAVPSTPVYARVSTMKG